MACRGLGGLAGVARGARPRVVRPSYLWVWLRARAAPRRLRPANLAGWWLGQGRMAPMARVSLLPPLLTLALLAGLWVWGQGGVPQVLGAWVAAKVLVAQV